MKLVRGLLLCCLFVTICFFYCGYGVSLAADQDIAKPKNMGKKKLEFWSNIRFRYEMQDNFNAKYYGSNPAQGKEDDSFLIGRFRFGFRYHLNKIIHLSVGVQHSEAWDLAMKDENFHKSFFEHQHNPYEDSWEPFNTFIEIKNLFPFSIRAGRQLIYYGNKRIFGPGAWGNSGRWMWDAVKIHYPFSRGFLDTYYGQTMIHDPNNLSWNHRSGFKSVGFYGQFKLPENFLGIAIEPFAMTKSNNHDVYKGEDRRVGDFDSYYIGARIFKKDYKGFDFDATYIKQEGDSASDDIDAYGYHCLLGYRAKQMPLKPRVSLEYTYASGDSNPTDGSLETFDGAFGARDKMMGRMNLFHWKNLKDAQINLDLKPMKTLSFTLGYHQFWLAEDKDAWYLNKKAYRDKTGNSGDKVGKEFDVLGKWTIPKMVEVQFGCGHFWPDEFAKNMASDKEANWVFLQLVYKFSHGIF